MNLRPKSKVNIELANERKAQIDEGVRIAKKVDDLRRTLSDLELQHSTFVSGMEKELKNKTLPLIEKIESLKNEIRSLEEKRKELLKPITKELSELGVEKEKIKEEYKLLDKVSQETDQKKKFIEEKAVKVKDMYSKAKIREIELSKAYLEIDNNRRETAEILIKTKDYKDEQYGLIAEEWKKVEIKANENTITLLSISNEREQIEIEKKFISEEKIRLADQRKTLERAMSRLKK